MTEINLALELLWRNSINPGRVVLGLGFYGRSKSIFVPMLPVLISCQVSP